MSWSYPMLSEIELFGGSDQSGAVSRPVNRVQRYRFVDACRGIFHVALIIDHLPVIALGVFATIATWFESVGYFPLPRDLSLYPGLFQAWNTRVFVVNPGSVLCRSRGYGARPRFMSAMWWQ